MLKPLKKVAKAIEHSMHLHAALHSMVEDGVELLHTIEVTEHEKSVIKSSSSKSRRAIKGR